MSIVDLTQQLGFYLSLFQFIFGLIGNSLNVVLFLQLKSFRKNRSAFYLIVESIFSSIFLLLYFFPQLLQWQWQIDLTITSIVWCKIRTTLNQSTRLTVATIISLEAIEQFCSTHHRLSIRQFFTIRSAHWFVFLSFCLWTLQTIPYLLFYEIIPSSGCVIVNLSLFAYYSYFYYPILHGLLPITFSVVFSLLAYRNVRRIIRRQIPIERRRFERQLTAMIFVRVILFVVCLLPYTIFRIYLLNVNVSSADVLRYEIQQILTVIVGFLLNLIYSTNFYVFLLTSRRFRRQVKSFLLKKLRRNKIQPAISVPEGNDFD